MIPRIIHRIWLDDPMPDEFAWYGKRWRDLHPEWLTLDWKHSDFLPPLRNRELFDSARDICPRDWKRFQADLLRLELLWRFGGVYADTDVEPLKPFDPLLDHEAFVAWSPNLSNGNQVLTQAVLGSVPQHPWLDACIAGIPEAVAKYHDQHLARMVGPHHVHRTWEAHPHGVTVLDSSLFYPQSNRQRDRGEQPDLSESYAWHRWANTRDKRHGGVEG